MSKQKKMLQPNWRPNFRISSTLPDIKLVRTGFTVNFIALALLCVAAFWIAQREYQAMILESSVEELESRVSAGEANDGKLVKLSQEFREKGRLIQELDRFLGAPFLPHEVLIALTNTQPDELVMSRLEFSERVRGEEDSKYLAYIVNVRGKAKNLPAVGRFKRKLENMELFNVAGMGVEVGETIEGRDDETGYFNYRIAATISPEEEPEEGEEEEEEEEEGEEEAGT